MISLEGRYTFCSSQGSWLVTATRNHLGLYDVRRDYDGLDLGHYGALDIIHLIDRGIWLPEWKS